MTTGAVATVKGTGNDIVEGAVTDDTDNAAAASGAGAGAVNVVGEAATGGNAVKLICGGTCGARRTEEVDIAESAEASASPGAAVEVEGTRGALGPGNVKPPPPPPPKAAKVLVAGGAAKVVAAGAENTAGAGKVTGGAVEVLNGAPKAGGDKDDDDEPKEKASGAAACGAVVAVAVEGVVVGGAPNTIGVNAAVPKVALPNVAVAGGGALNEATGAGVALLPNAAGAFPNVAAPKEKAGIAGAANAGTADDIVGEVINAAGSSEGADISYTVF